MSFVGTRIGPYEVKSPLGEGGMGVVFRARDTVSQRDVALKLLPDTFAKDTDRFARFQREAQVLASLNRFLMNTVTDEAVSPITVILNWKPPKP